TQVMRFSFLLAVVAVLTASMSVSMCGPSNGVCSSSSASNDTCCSRLIVTQVVRRAQV
ncbi:hypothetical protein BDR03DRAFT_949476, partial [Suillus americanus]